MRTALLILCINLLVIFIEAKKLTPAERALKAQQQNAKSHEAWVNLYKSSKTNKTPDEVEKTNSPVVVTPVEKSKTLPAAAQKQMAAKIGQAAPVAPALKGASVISAPKVQNLPAQNALPLSAPAATLAKPVVHVNKKEEEQKKARYATAFLCFMHVRNSCSG